MKVAYQDEPALCLLDTSYHLTQIVTANLREGIAVLDHDLRFILWNHCMEDLTGVAEKSVIGKQVIDLFPSIHGLGIARNVQRALAGESICARAMIGRTDGKAKVIYNKDAHLFNEENLVWTILDYSPWRGTNGAVAGVIVVVSDLTERVRAKRQLNDTRVRSQAVIDHMLDGMAMVSSDGKIESFNLAAERIYGYKADEVIGQNVAMLFICPVKCEKGGYLHDCPITGEHGITGAGREVLGLRKDQSITQVQLAELLGVSQQTITAYESGRRRVPISHLPRLATLLGASVETLIGQPATPASKRGPTPKLLQQLERLHALPKAKQRMVSEVLDSLLAQAGR